MVVLDTCVIIDHLRQKKFDQETALLKIAKQQPKETLGLCLISVQELYEGKSTQNQQKEQQLLATIAPLKILPFTLETAQLAGEIARDAKKPMELADAQIAASCLLGGHSLLTLNQSDFIHIKGLSLVDLE